MAYWLMKSEPDELSIERLAQLGQTRWDGVRNYQARNFIRSMAVGDAFFFYHSSCAVPGIAGIGQIETAAYPDPTALDRQSPYHDSKASPERNPWSALDVGHVKTFAKVVSLGRLKQQAALEELALVQKGSRLSVMPVTAEQWAAILALAGAGA
jgi:predicted RNA-binding protein with PUA-like domain